MSCDGSGVLIGCWGCSQCRAPYPSDPPPTRFELDPEHVAALDAAWRQHDANQARAAATEPSY